MTSAGLTNEAKRSTDHVMARTIMMAALAATALAGCVNVTAPDKPIEINLNINVTQQVVVKLDNAAKSAIQANPGIF